MNDRPTRLTPEMALAAARNTAADLARDGHIDNAEIESNASDIAKHGRLHIDGYDLAKALDTRCYWTINAMMVEMLDCFSSHAQHEIDVAEKAWAMETKPIPPHEIGTAICFRSGETGVIDGIYEYGPAKYTVKIDGDKQANGPMKSRRIVNFEDAKLIPEEVM